MQRKRFDCRNFALATAAVVALGLFLAPSASAGIYSDNKGHYSFSYPDAWAAANAGGSDAAYNGTFVNGFAPTVVAIHNKENQAEDTAAWLLTYAQDQFNTVNGTVTTTEVQAPRTFTTAGGRLAADFVFEYNDSGTVLRERQVLFVSAGLNTGVLLALTDNASTYDTHAADWASIVDSFAFEGEPEIPADLAIIIDGGSNTTVQPNATVRFAINRTLPNGLAVEWFRNGTSVGNGTSVDLTMPPGLAVISVKVSNATAERSLSTTITSGTPTTTPPPATPGTTSTGSSGLLIPLLVALVAIGALVYFAALRPKQRKPKTPSEGATPAGLEAPAGPPRNP